MATIMKNRKVANNIGELIEALEQFEANTPIQSGFDYSLEIHTLHDYDTGEFVGVSIESVDE